MTSAKRNPIPTGPTDACIVESPMTAAPLHSHLHGETMVTTAAAPRSLSLTRTRVASARRLAEVWRRRTPSTFSAAPPSPSCRLSSHRNRSQRSRPVASCVCGGIGKPRECSMIAYDAHPMELGAAYKSCAFLAARDKRAPRSRLPARHL
jgi:hypothetical protein